MENNLSLNATDLSLSANYDNRELTQQFLLHTHRGGAWGYYWIKKGKKTIWWPSAQPAPIPPEGIDWYFGVHPTALSKDDHHRSRIADIVAVNAIFLDVDAKSFDNGKSEALEHIQTLPIPSIIIDSGGGYQVYYLFDEPFLIATEADRDFIRNLQSDWVLFAKADKAAKDIARVLRIPGTFNGKYEDLPEVKFIWADFGRLYKVSELREMVPVVEPKKKARKNPSKAGSEPIEELPVRLIHREMPKLVNDLFGRLEDAEAREKIYKNYVDGQPVYYNTRSEAEAGIVSTLILQGWEYDEISREFAARKPSHYIEENDPDRYLRLTYAKCLQNICEDGLRPEIERAYKIASVMAWEGKTGGSDRDVMMALLSKSYQFNRWTISVSTRERSEFGALSITCVSNAVKRLEARGFLKIIVPKTDDVEDEEGFESEKEESGDESGGKDWKKKRPTGTYDLAPFYQKVNTEDISHQGGTTRVYCPGIARARHTWRDAELWSSKLLGRSAKLVFDVLDEEIKTVGMIARLTGKCERTCRTALEKLKYVGLARWIAGGWVPGPCTLDEVADRYGCSRKALDRRDIYTEDRKWRNKDPQDAMGY